MQEYTYTLYIHCVCWHNICVFSHTYSPLSLHRHIESLSKYIPSISPFFLQFQQDCLATDILFLFKHGGVKLSEWRLGDPYPLKTTPSLSRPVPRDHHLVLLFAFVRLIPTCFGICVCVFRFYGTLLTLFPFLICQDQLGFS